MFAAIAWLLPVWFERTMADEPVVFGSLAILLLVMLVFCLPRRERASGVTTVPSNAQVQVVGNGGWRILPAIGLALSPVLGMIDLVVDLAALLAWLCVIAVQFFKKMQSLPQLPHNIIRFMIWRPVASLNGKNML